MACHSESHSQTAPCHEEVHGLGAIVIERLRMNTNRTLAAKQFYVCNCLRKAFDKFVVEFTPLVRYKFTKFQVI